MYIEQSAHSSGSVLGWPAVCARLYSYCCLSELDLCKCCVERYVGLQKVLSYVTDLTLYIQRMVLILHGFICVSSLFDCYTQYIE